MAVNPAAPLLPPNNKVWFGLYSAPEDGTWVNPNNVDRTNWFRIRELTVRQGFGSALAPTTVDIGMQFYGWSNDLRGLDATDVDLTQWHHDGGRIPMITWQPGSTPGGMEAIRAGTHDDYIRMRFSELKALGFPVMLRFAHEMNGDWYTWNPWHKENGVYTNAPETRTEMWRWREAWRRVWRLCHNPATGQPAGQPAGAGATNIAFVWCPGTGSAPSTPNNDKWQFYPGDAYVDWVGLDGYAGGSTETWAGNWDTCMTDMHTPRSSMSYAADKPIIICETSSNPACRVAYLQDAGMAITSAQYPNLRGLLWFDQTKSDGSWAFDTTQDWGQATMTFVKLANVPMLNPRYTGPGA